MGNSILMYKPPKPKRKRPKYVLPDLPQEGIFVESRQLLEQLHSAWTDAKERQMKSHNSSSGHMRGLEEAIALVHLMLVEKEIEEQ